MTQQRRPAEIPQSEWSDLCSPSKHHHTRRPTANEAKLHLVTYKNMNVKAAALLLKYILRYEYITYSKSKDQSCLINGATCRADSSLAPSQRDTSLQGNGVSHWLGASLKWALNMHRYLAHVFCFMTFLVMNMLGITYVSHTIALKSCDTAAIFYWYLPISTINAPEVGTLNLSLKSLPHDGRKNRK